MNVKQMAARTCSFLQKSLRETRCRRQKHCDFLEWKIDWSHTFGDNFPVYLQLSKDSSLIHLSEHYGDACPGSTLKINVENIEDIASKLKDKNYKYSKPGVEIMPWKTKEMWIHDPFGNKLMFYQDIPD